MLQKKRRIFSSYYCFSVQLDRPVHWRLVKTKKWKLKSLIKGPKSWYEIDGQTSVECQGVVFTFHASPDQLYTTSETRGQFPVLCWSHVMEKITERQRCVESHGVLLLTFRSLLCANNRTNKVVGQFPVLFWSARH